MNETHALFTHIDTSERRKLALAKQAAEQQLERIDEGPPASLCKFESHKIFHFFGNNGIKVLLVPPVVQLKMGSTGPDRESPRKTKLEHEITVEARDFFDDQSRSLTIDEVKFKYKLAQLPDEMI